MNKKIANVTVIIPCYKSSKTIMRAVDSIAHQTLLPSEVILIDDASSDECQTLDRVNDLVKKYLNILNIKVISLESNKGVANARNIGWNLATGEYIALLDADDAWHPRKLEIQYNWMLAHPEYGLSGHGYLIFDQNNHHQWSVLSAFQTSRKIEKLYSLLSNPFATRTVMLKRALSFKFKGDKRYSEDYLLWLEIILSGTLVAYINEPLAATFKNDYGAGGLSANLWKMEEGELDVYWQIYKNNKISFLMAMLLCLYSLIKYLKRIVVVRICIKKT